MHTALPHYRILILRFSSIGDIVLTTPVVRCLKKQLPETEVHYLTKPAFKSILEHNPYIDHIHVLDKPLWEKIAELKELGFDLVIDLHNNLRTRIIKGLLDVPSHSFNKLNVEKWWRVHGKINMLPDVHIVDRYMDPVSSLGVVNDEEGLDYFLPPDIAGSFSNIALPETYIAFAIGAQHATKRLPNEKIIAICKQIPLPVLLLGGKEDRPNADLIVQTAGSHVINLCGTFSLHQSAYVIKQAHNVITHDTGLMHIAAAFKKEIISVWGNTIPEFGMTPYYGKYEVKQVQAEIKDLYCRPCSKIGFNKCPLGHFKCMMLQDEVDIAMAANSDPAHLSAKKM